ncbi:MAG TPA: type II toxin-antitoxin system HicA family toxin [Anaerolineae bacterium]|nr:type II toxin-antitoxin system HicA family toxin [Anaerolineae bacterium]
MSKRDKLLEKIRRNPKDVTFKELDQLLHAFGYELVRTKGSHSAYRRPGAPPVTVARRQPHVHSDAVKEVLRILDSLPADD